jgi:branched-subunit amino acid transport protein
MLFDKSDLQIHDSEDFLEFAPIFIFIALIAPLVLAAYGLGFILDQIGWLDTSS